MRLAERWKGLVTEAFSEQESQLAFLDEESSTQVLRNWLMVFANAVPEEFLGDVLSVAVESPQSSGVSTIYGQRASSAFVSLKPEYTYIIPPQLGLSVVSIHADGWMPSEGAIYGLNMGKFVALSGKTLDWSLISYPSSLRRLAPPILAVPTGATRPWMMADVNSEKRRRPFSSDEVFDAEEIKRQAKYYEQLYRPCAE